MNYPRSDSILPVTGASRGIGATIATTLAQHGCAVVVNYNNSAAEAKILGKQINKDYDVTTYAVQADVSKPEEVAQLFEKTVKVLGRVDIVVSNAGVEHFGNLAAVQPEEIDHVFDVNVKGQFFVAQQAEKYMEERGRLILTSSVSAVMVCSHALEFLLLLSLTLRNMARAYHITQSMRRPKRRLRE